MAMSGVVSKKVATGNISSLNATVKLYVCYKST